jgi:phage terminase small subunit
MPKEKKSTLKIKAGAKPKQEIIKGDLNERHKLFVLEYLKNGFNAKQAYISIYKPKSELGAESNSIRLIGNDKIQEFLRSEQENMKLSKRITIESQLKELDEIKKMAKTPEGDGKAQLAVFVKAVEVQNKMLGLDAPTKLEMTGKDGGAIKTESTLNIKLL